MRKIRVCQWHRKVLYLQGVFTDGEIVRGPGDPTLFTMSDETLGRFVAATRELLDAGELSSFRIRDARRFLIDAGA